MKIFFYRAFVYSGAFDIAADSPHGTLVYNIIETTRDCAIESKRVGVTNTNTNSKQNYVALVKSSPGHAHAGMDKHHEQHKTGGNRPPITEQSKKNRIIATDMEIINLK